MHPIHKIYSLKQINRIRWVCLRVLLCKVNISKWFVYGAQTNTYSNVALYVGNWWWGVDDDAANFRRHEERREKRFADPWTSWFWP